MRITKLVIAADRLNAALGSGRFAHITAGGVWPHIEDGSIFRYLATLLETNVAFSVLSPADRLELLLEWEGMRGCVDPFPMDGHRNGLCLLLGYILAGIARRAQDRDYRLTLETCGAAVPGGQRDL